MRNVLSFYAPFLALLRSSSLLSCINGTVQGPAAVHVTSAASEQFALLLASLRSLHVSIQSRHQKLAGACVVAGSLGPASTPSKQRVLTRPLCQYARPMCLELLWACWLLSAQLSRWNRVNAKNFTLAAGKRAENDPSPPVDVVRSTTVLTTACQHRFLTNL